MKAAVCHTFGAPLVVEQINLDPPATGEVRVKLAACAICQSDIHYADGAWGGVLPAVYGHEAAGIVDAVGPGVSRARPGDHVVATLLRACGACPYCAREEAHLCDGELALDRETRLHAADGSDIRQGLRTGGFAEYAIVDQSQVVPIAEDVPLESAALLACGVITGYGAVTNVARVAPGESVVVIGTGGVGLNSVQGAAIAGADPVIAIDTEPTKLDAAEAFGASHGIDAAQDDVKGAVRALTGGRGADHVFVTVGSAKAMSQGLGLLCRGGALVIVGMPASGVTIEIEPLEFADVGQRILGSKMGSTRLDTDIPKLVALYRDGRLKLDELISGRYPLAEINEAIASARRGEALRNVIVF